MSTSTYQKVRKIVPYLVFTFFVATILGCASSSEGLGGTLNSTPSSATADDTHALVTDSATMQLLDDMAYVAE